MHTTIKCLAMKNLIKVSTIILLLIGVNACSTPETDYHKIPGTATFVAKVTMPELVEKSNINYVRDSVGFGLVETAFGFIEMPNFLKDRTITGIDFTKNIYAFKADSTKGSPLVSLFWIANEDSLQRFVKQMDKSMLTEESDEITTIHFEMGTIVYKQERAYFTQSKDTAAIALLSSYFNLAKDKSLDATHPDVVKNLEAGDDIGMWTSQRKLLDFESPLAFTNQKEAVVRKTIAALNFNQGQLELNYGEIGNEQLTDLYQQALRGEFNEELLRGLPESNLPGLVSFHVKPATHLEQMARFRWYTTLAATNGYSQYAAGDFSQMMHRLENTFSGASVWGITGFKTKKEEGRGGLFKQDVETAFFNWHIAIGLDDAATADSLLDNMANAAGTRLEGGKSYFTYPGAPFPFLLSVENGILLISNDEAHMQDLLTKDLPIPAWKGNTNEEIAQYPIYAMLNPEIWSIMADPPKGLSAQAVIASLTGNALLAVDRIKVKGYSHGDTALRIDMEMAFSNNSENALELLLTSMFEKLSFESLQGGF